MRRGWGKLGDGPVMAGEIPAGERRLRDLTMGCKDTASGPVKSH